MSNHLAKEKKEEAIGTQVYASFGKIFLGCGIGFFLLFLYISSLPQDYEKYNIPLFFGCLIGISVILMALGITILVLCKKSKRFQAWAEKDVMNAGKKLLEKEMKREEKKNLKK